MNALEVLILVLVVLWATGHWVFNLGNLVHLLLVVALVMFIYDMATRNRIR